MSKEMLQCLCAMTVAAILLTSPWVSSAPVEEGLTFCSVTLNQTRSQEKNCTKVPNQYQTAGDASSDNYYFFLLCCMGGFPIYSVEYNYIKYFNFSFFSYLKNNVADCQEVVKVAHFVKQSTPPGHQQLLDESNYLDWTGNYKTDCGIDQAKNEGCCNRA